MDNEQIYNQWLQSKTTHAISEDFVDTVLQKITAPRKKIKITFVSPEIINEWISRHLPAKLTMITAGGFGGALRIAASLYLLLFT
jgi:hypothetical protein